MFYNYHYNEGDGMHKKQQFGQFFTKNTDYILSGLSEFVKNKKVCDPFAGAGDLLDWAKENNAASVSGFDIDKKFTNNIIKLNDSLKKPKKYDFILTNPPYLYQNKMEDNTLLKNTRHTDLYQLSLEKIMNSNEGIVIVPINFLSAENSKYIRNLFLNKFDIIKANYFTEQVFSDTTYNVIAFYYKKKSNLSSEKMEIDFSIFPENKHKLITIYKKYNWQIGGEFLIQIKKYSNKLQITRLEQEDLKSGNNTIKIALNHLKDAQEMMVDNDTWQQVKHNIIILKAIDTGTNSGRICLEDIRSYGYDALVSIKTSRNQIGLIFPPFVSIDDQEKLIHLFNTELNQKRDKYDSLFMTNFRDKGRKRISFNFAYNFINYLYFDKLKGHNKKKSFNIGVI